MYLVFGYYHRKNLGDELYKLVIPALLHDIKPIELEFICLDDVKTISVKEKLSNVNAIFIGGGDLLNAYFMISIRYLRENFNGPIIGLSIGFPFESMITNEHLTCFDLLYTRNQQDLAMIRRKTDSLSCMYIPDPVFLLKSPSDPVVQRKGISVSIPGNLFKFPGFFDKAVRLMNKMGTKRKVTLITFDLSSGDESDLIPYKRLKEACPNIDILETENGNDIISFLRTSEVFVTGRYHGIILSCVTETPLIVLRATRKIQIICDAMSFPVGQIVNLQRHGDDPNIFKLSVNKVYHAVNLILTKVGPHDTSLEGITFQKKYTNSCRKYLSTFFNKEFGNKIMRQVETLIDSREENLIKDLDSFTDFPEGHKSLTSKVLGSIISQKTTGIPDSKYLYGIEENLKKGISISSMIAWIRGDRKQNVPPIIENLPIVSNPPRNSYYLPIEEYEVFHGLHRYGWSWIFNHLSGYSKRNGIYLDSFVDRTFHWCHDYNVSTGKLPYHHEWIGFIHHPMQVIHSENSTENLFKKKSFLDSLFSCQGLYVLAMDLKRSIQQKLHDLKLSIPVHFLEHPTGSPSNDSLYFNYKLWDEFKPIISIGGWQRRPLDIYRMVYDNKFVLRGPRMDSIFPPRDLQIIVSRRHRRESDSDGSSSGKSISLDDVVDDSKNLSVSGSLQIGHHDGPCRPTNCGNAWLTDLNKLFPQIIINGNTVVCPDRRIKERIIDMINSVRIVENVSNDEYDKLLSRNVVFLSLYDCAAVNTVNECISRRTPLIVNALPEIQRLLSDKYPLYWSDLSTIKELLTKDRLNKASEIMRGISKKLDMNSFLLNFHSSEALTVRKD